MAFSVKWAGFTGILLVIYRRYKFFNGYLMTPGEMNDFVDSFKSDRVRVHFDTGNIMIDN